MLEPLDGLFPCVEPPPLVASLYAPHTSITVLPLDLLNNLHVLLLVLRCLLHGNHDHLLCLHELGLAPAVKHPATVGFPEHAPHFVNCPVLLHCGFTGRRILSNVLKTLLHERLLNDRLETVGNPVLLTSVLTPRQEDVPQVRLEIEVQVCVLHLGDHSLLEVQKLGFLALFMCDACVQHTSCLVMDILIIVASQVVVDNVLLKFAVLVDPVRDLSLLFPVLHHGKKTPRKGLLPDLECPLHNSISVLFEPLSLLPAHKIMPQVGVEHTNEGI